MDLFQGVTEFIAVADAGSFVKAASALDMTKSGVGKAVSRLEARLGTRLFNRTTRSLSLTDEGRSLLAHSRDLVTEMRDVQDRLGGSNAVPRGKLTVNMAVSIGHLLVVPSLGTFLRQNPTLTIDVRLNDRPIDLTDEGVDVAIRFGDLPDSTLVARRLGQMRFTTFASPAYLQEHGDPETLQDLSRHECMDVRFASGRHYEWQFTNQGRPVSLPIVGRMILSSGEAVLAAAIAGAGIGQLYDYMPRPAIEAGLLRPVLTAFAGAGRAVSLVYPSQRHLSAKVKVFIDHCSEVLKPHLD